MTRKLLSIAVLLCLAGCAAQTANTKPRKAPPLPPMPPGMTKMSMRPASVSAVVDPVHLVSVVKFGGNNSDAGDAVVADPAGNVFVAGSTGRPFLTKCSPSGASLWSLPFLAGVGSGAIQAVATDTSGAVFVTGRFAGVSLDFGGGPLTNKGGNDIFVAKYSSTGAHLWSKSFGDSAGASDEGRGIAVDPRDNSVVVTGFFQNDINLGGGRFPADGQGMFIVKFSGAGAHVWSVGVSNNNFQSTVDGNAVAIDGSGNIFVTGYFNRGSVNFGHGAINSAANTETFLAKYSASGSNVWAKAFGGWQSFGYAVSADRFGSVLLAGRFDSDMSLGGQMLTNAGTMDVFVGKLSAADGSHIWSKRFGAGAPDFGYGVTTDNAGNVFLTGSGRFNVDFGGTPLPVTTPTSAFVVKFSAAGVHQWSKIFGAGHEEGKAVVVAAGRVYVAGRFSGAVDFGGISLTSAGSWDVFLAEFSEPTTTPPPSGERPVQIFEWDATHYGVLGIQTNTPGGTCEFLMSANVTGPWQFMANPGWLAQGESGLVVIPKIWLPENRLFVDVISRAAPVPAAFAPASLSTTVKLGYSLSLVSTNTNGRPFPVYRAKKL